MFLIKRVYYCVSSVKLKEYYRVLGVAPTSTDKEIKAQFFKLAKQHHPDTGKHKDEHKFKEILEAYKYLSNPNNPRTEDASSNAQHQPNQQYSTREEQAAYSQETRYQRIRRETYQYFNRMRREHEAQHNETNSGYDSFVETVKAAPELIIMTVFIGVVIAQWFWTMPRHRRPYSVYYRVFETEEEEQLYYQRQRTKYLQKARMFDSKAKFDRDRSQ